MPEPVRVGELLGDAAVATVVVEAPRGREYRD
jgi:hypothetical protein